MTESPHGTSYPWSWPGAEGNVDQLAGAQKRMPFHVLGMNRFLGFPKGRQIGWMVFLGVIPFLIFLLEPANAD